MSDELEVPWQFDPREGPVTRFQAQPIVVDGVLYAPSPGGFSVIALDGGTGELKWSWNAGTRTAARGVTYWTDGTRNACSQHLAATSTRSIPQPAVPSPVSAATVGSIFTRISGVIPNVSQ